MNYGPGWRKAVSALTVATFIVTNIHVPLYALPDLKTQNPAASLPQGVSSVQLPSDLGKIEESFQGTETGTVVIVQDAHAVPDAQKSIQNIIEHFIQNYGVSLVGLEGASALLDPQMFKSFPDQKLLKEMFDEYSAQGELTGGSAAAIFSNQNTTFTGIEDWKLYEKGFGLFLEASEKENELRSKLTEWERDLDTRKKAEYPEKLFKIDQELKTFQNNELSLLDVMKSLAAVKPPEPGSELAILLEESAKEGKANVSIDIEVRELAKTVEKHLKSQSLRGAERRSNLRSQIASTTSETSSRNDEVLKLFNEKRQEFQTSRLSAQAFALWMKDFVQKDNIPVKVSGALFGGMKNQKMLRDIEGTKFFQNLEDYAQSVKDSLMSSDAARGLDKETYYFNLLSHFARLELSRENWKEIEQLVIPEIFNRESKISGSPTSTTKHGGSDALFGGKAFGNDPEKSLKAHFEFYQNAEERDQAFVENISKFANSKKTQDAIIVAGGFHAQGLSERLKAKNISHILVVPAIGSLPAETAYKRQMNGNVSWKDYFRAENGKINVYQAFVRATRDRLVKNKEGANDQVVLKTWRDQIIRDLAEKEQISKAGEYTRFIDEVAARSGTGIADEELKRGLEKINRFIEGLRGLQNEQRLTQDNVVKLLSPSTIQTGIGTQLVSSNAFDARLIRVSPSASNKVRSEVRQFIVSNKVNIREVLEAIASTPKIEARHPSDDTKISVFDIAIYEGIGVTSETLTIRIDRNNPKKIHIGHFGGASRTPLSASIENSAEIDQILAKVYEKTASRDHLSSANQEARSAIDNLRLLMNDKGKRLPPLLPPLARSDVRSIVNDMLKVGGIVALSVAVLVGAIMYPPGGSELKKQADEWNARPVEERIDILVENIFEFHEFQNNNAMLGLSTIGGESQLIEIGDEALDDIEEAIEKSRNEETQKRFSKILRQIKARSESRREVPQWVWNTIAFTLLAGAVGGFEMLPKNADPVSRNQPSALSRKIQPQSFLNLTNLVPKEPRRTDDSKSTQAPEPAVKISAEKIDSIFRSESRTNTPLEAKLKDAIKNEFSVDRLRRVLIDSLTVPRSYAKDYHADDNLSFVLFLADFLSETPNSRPLTGRDSNGGYVVDRIVQEIIREDEENKGAISLLEIGNEIANARTGTVRRIKDRYSDGTYKVTTHRLGQGGRVLDPIGEEAIFSADQLMRYIGDSRYVLNRLSMRPYLNVYDVARSEMRDWEVESIAHQIFGTLVLLDEETGTTYAKTFRSYADEVRNDPTKPYRLETPEQLVAFLEPIVADPKAAPYKDQFTGFISKLRSEMREKMLEFFEAFQALGALETFGIAPTAKPDPKTRKQNLTKAFKALEVLIPDQAKKVQAAEDAIMKEAKAVRIDEGVVESVESVARRLGPKSETVKAWKNEKAVFDYYVKANKWVMSELSKQPLKEMQLFVPYVEPNFMEVLKQSMEKYKIDSLKPHASRPDNFRINASGSKIALNVADDADLFFADLKALFGEEQFEKFRVTKQVISIKDIVKRLGETNITPKSELLKYLKQYAETTAKVAAEKRSSKTGRRILKPELSTGDIDAAIAKLQTINQELGAPAYQGKISVKGFSRAILDRSKGYIKDLQDLKQKNLKPSTPKPSAPSAQTAKRKTTTADARPFKKFVFVSNGKADVAAIDKAISSASSVEVRQNGSEIVIGISSEERRLALKIDQNKPQTMDVTEKTRTEEEKVTITNLDDISQIVTGALYGEAISPDAKTILSQFYERFLEYIRIEQPFTSRVKQTTAPVTQKAASESVFDQIYGKLPDSRSAQLVAAAPLVVRSESRTRVKGLVEMLVAAKAAASLAERNEYAKFVETEVKTFGLDEFAKALEDAFMEKINAAEAGVDAETVQVMKNLAHYWASLLAGANEEITLGLHITDKDNALTVESWVKALLDEGLKAGLKRLVVAGNAKPMDAHRTALKNYKIILTTVNQISQIRSLDDNPVSVVSKGFQNDSTPDIVPIGVNATGVDESSWNPVLNVGESGSQVMIAIMIAQAISTIRVMNEAEIRNQLNFISSRLFPKLQGEEILEITNVEKGADGLKLSLNINRSAFMSYISRLRSELRAAEEIATAA